MPYSGASIANGFLNLAFKSRKSITPMKMQKLVYLAHGYGLVECDEPILDEVFEAWKFGPVLNSLYHECKRYGKGGINDFLKDIDMDFDTISPAPVPGGQKVSEIIDFVWKNYGDQSAISLSDWTHQRGGPWDEVTNGGRSILRHQDVPNELIKKYFERNMYDNSEETTSATVSA